MRRRGRSPYPDALTPRESDVLELVRQGLTNEQISQRLGVSPNGVKYHVAQILSKLGVGSRAEAAAWRSDSKPWWANAVFLVGWPLKHLSWSAGVKVVASAGLVAGTAGTGMLIWSAVDNGDIEEVAFVVQEGSPAPGGDDQPTPTPTPTPIPTPTLRPTPPGRIAFVSYREGDSDISLMNADGSGVINLTNNPAGYGQAAWSPDGTRIAFDSDRDGDLAEIYLMNVDGSGIMRLTNNPAEDVWPHWSPDGTRIAFQSDRDGDAQIYVMNADGSGVMRITDEPASALLPIWSPDGEMIAFVSVREGESDIFVMNADGSGVTNLTNHPASDGWPSWSPNGGRIAFASSRDDLGGEIYSMNVDGSGVTRLTDVEGTDGFPAWSPDGTRIAFVSTRAERLEQFPMGADIYVMNVDGSEVTRLTYDATYYETNPAWSPLP